MALSVEQLLDHPAIVSAIRIQAGNLLAVFDRDARLAGLFGTYQRWLMSQAALSLYFHAELRAAGSGFLMKDYLQKVEDNDIASRNTADAFVKQLIQYKYVDMLGSAPDRRQKPLAPSAVVQSALDYWMTTHLGTLDLLTGGNRVARYRATPRALARMQSLISDELVRTGGVVDTEDGFTPSKWLDNGGLLIDWLVTTMEDEPLSAERVIAPAMTIPEIADKLDLSRTHLSRKLQEAEKHQMLGWTGRRGHSPLWISRKFRYAYFQAQAVKLSIVDHAAETAVLHSAAD